VDVGPDADRTLRCAVTAGDDVKLFARRGDNLDDTFSDATKGEWRFDYPVVINKVICNTTFVANNRNDAM